LTDLETAICAYVAEMNGCTSGNGTDVSDEQWIVNQATLHRESDIHAAKAWLIVGKTLFSRSFDIQVLLRVSAA